MASRSLTVIRRSLLAKRSFHTTSLQKGGTTPPLPPFARSPQKWESLTENHDAVWDDGVAPELALDFDCPNTSSQEALYTWAGAFGVFFLLYQGIKFVTSGAKDDNPALPQGSDCVDKDYSDHAKVPVSK